MAEKFPKQVRLLRASEFERVFAARVLAGDEAVVMHGAPNELGHPRLGIVASRRIGGAVTRNRWKRMLREAFRLSQHQLAPLDLICIPRAGDIPPLEELKSSIVRLAKRVERKATDSARRLPEGPST